MLKLLTNRAISQGEILYYQKNEELVDSWNKTLAVVAKLASVPVALVMKVENETIRVFSKNDSQKNPYNIGDSEYLNGSGLYCERVIKSQNQLHIPNALADEEWKDNPDIKLNMIAYLGLPIIDDKGSPFGTVCILDTKEHAFSETTIELLETIKQSFEVQLKQLHQQHIAVEKQQLEELSILITGLSHEINTPLGIGVTTTSVIESNIDDIQQKLNSKSLNQSTLTHCLSTMKESIKLLSNSLNHAADKVSNLQDLLISDETNDPQALDLYPLVKSIFNKYEDMYKTHGVKYTVKYDTGQPTHAYIDSSLLQQVLFILCKNSLEHGLVGVISPEILVELTSYNNVIKLHFKDNGKGIDKREHVKIFSPFYTTNRKIGCSGIGLSLAKRIITQQLHGEISIVESSIGVHFIIDLPKNNIF